MKQYGAIFAPDILFLTKNLMIMVFHLKTKIVLNKEFDIEAEELRDAMQIAEAQLVGGMIDFNELEFETISYDLTDPSIRAYNHAWCAKRVKEYKNALQDNS